MYSQLAQPINHTYPAPSALATTTILGYSYYLLAAIALASSDRKIKHPSPSPSQHHASSLSLVSLRRSRAAVCSFAHIYAVPGCESGPVSFKAGQAFTAVYNRASRLSSGPGLQSGLNIYTPSSRVAWTYM